MNTEPEPNPEPKGAADMRSTILLPRAALFAKLRDMWLAKHNKPDRKATSAGLAVLLGLSRQKLHDFAAGARPCPDWVLMHLCQDLRLEVHLRPTEIVIGPVKRTTGETVDWAHTAVEGA